MIRFALLAVLATQDDSAFHPKQGVYEFRIGGELAGVETVEFTADGWKAKGKCDQLRILQADYEAELVRGKDGAIRWKARVKRDKNETTVEAELKDSKAVVRSNGKEKTLDLSNKPHPFFYADLVWVQLETLGRILAAEGRAEKLQAGVAFTAIYGPGAIPLEMKLAEFSRSTQVFRDRSVTLWVFVINLGGVEFKLLCSPEGLPLRIAVPARLVDVAMKEFAALEFPETKPLTIVDSGEWRTALSKAKHDVKVEKKVMMPMRDGVKLAADIYRPAGEGKFPAILARTPYRREGEGMMKGTYFACRGYVFIAQDVRGRFDSEGEWFPLRNETNDGSDAIDWIAKQPWCDGNVGMIGASYVGWVQWYAAKSGNPHLKAIVPEVSPPDPDQNIPYEGGAFMLSTAWWARQLEAMGQKTDWIAKFKTLPLGDVDKALDVKHPFLDEWLAHPPDDPYWDPLRYQNCFDRIDVPALHLSGWFDGDQPGAVQNFAGMRKAGHKGQFLVLGPWSHAFNMFRKLGSFDFGPEAVIDWNSVALRFFDKYLKGVDNGIDRDDPVCIFVMGENRWRREKDWPPPAMTPTKLYLASDGCAHRRCCSGRLGLAPQDQAPEDEFRYDPMDPPETLADFDDMVGASVSLDCSGLKDRDDILDYTSPPLAGPVELTGPLSATLSVSTDAADTDFVASWYRLMPDGKMYGITSGIQRLRYRHGKDAPVKPGEIVQVEIDCWATSLRLEKGERIRLEVSSCGFPGYARNLNTLEPQATATKSVVATNRVYHDAKRPSFLLLPVVPSGLRFE